MSTAALHPRLLTPAMEAAVERCRLSLSGAVVLTEAASGPYVVTPVLAALAGAERVYALGRGGRHGSLEEVSAQTHALARFAGVGDRIEIVAEKSPDLLARADVVTNSGHLRPLDAANIRALKPSAVITLMYEAWELRPRDLDLSACRERGIRIAGTNECHPAIDVFSFLGAMAAKLLFDAGIAVYRTRILLLCDNAFAPYMKRALEGMGAQLDVAERLPEVHVPQDHAAIVVAMRPRMEPVLSPEDARRIGQYWRRALVAQFFGDLDRDGLAAADVPVVPDVAPLRGHMGVLPSAIGPEPIVRLQSGGLKVAEVLLKKSPGAEDLAFVQMLPL